MNKILEENRLLVTFSTFLRVIFLWLLIVAITMIALEANAQQTNNLAQSDTEKQARILVRSSARVDVRTELYAPVLKIPFGEGQQFTAGDILIKFDCSRYDAERKAAGAAAHASDIEHRTKRKLFEYQAVGKDEVRLAAALSAKANAELKVHKVRAGQCEYKAPFDGRIVDQYVREHEFPASDKPLLTILNDSELELQLVVPSIWLRWIETGLEFRFEIDETGETHKGIITRLGAEVDPVSQTIKVIGSFKSLPSRVLAGMSGTAYFPAGS